VRYALNIWEASTIAIDRVTESYLAGRNLGAFDLRSGHVIRHHQVCPFRLEDDSRVTLPTMISLYRDIVTNQPVGIHRTALKSDGSGKSDLPGLGSPKKMLGHVGDAAIKLSADSEVTDGLGIAEGIETALSVYCANWRPVWALGSAGAIAKFPVLPGVESLTIFADADAAGMKAAAECRARWRQAGREATILLPPIDGQDFNDVARAA
jgi:hypothetical protein